MYSNYIKNDIPLNVMDYIHVVKAGRKDFSFIKKMPVNTICDHNRVLYLSCLENNLLTEENKLLLKKIVIDSKLSVTKLIKINRSESSINKFSDLTEYSYKKKILLNKKYNNENYKENKKIVLQLLNENKYIYGIYNKLYNNINDVFIRQLIEVICFLRYRIDRRFQTLGL